MPLQQLPRLYGLDANCVNSAPEAGSLRESYGCVVSHAHLHTRSGTGTWTRCLQHANFTDSLNFCSCAMERAHMVLACSWPQAPNMLKVRPHVTSDSLPAHHDGGTLLHCCCTGCACIHTAAPRCLSKCSLFQLCANCFRLWLRPGQARQLPPHNPPAVHPATHAKP